MPKYNGTKEQHGMTHTPEYRSWNSMHQRCHDEIHPAYHKYGGNGITICERWNSFQAFYEDMGPRPEGTSLDRINPYGNYEPSNCRWATPRQQANNRRESISSMARKCDLTPKLVLGRLRKGWPIEDALTVEKGHRQDGLPSQTELARIWGMSRERVRQILNRAGLHKGRRPLDWKYIDKHGLRTYANQMLNIREQETK